MTARLPTTTRAMTFERYGEPHVVQVRHDAPVPSAGPGEVLVKVVCAAQSRASPVRLPCTLGMEGSGVWAQQVPGFRIRGRGGFALPDAASAGRSHG